MALARAPANFRTPWVRGVSAWAMGLGALRRARRWRQGDAVLGTPCSGRQTAAGAPSGTGGCRSRLPKAAQMTGFATMGDHLAQAKVSVPKRNREGKKVTGAAMPSESKAGYTSGQAAPSVGGSPNDVASGSAVKAPQPSLLFPRRSRALMRAMLSCQAAWEGARGLRGRAAAEDAFLPGRQSNLGSSAGGRAMDGQSGRRQGQG